MIWEPGHAFAAIGPQAAWITAPHSIDVPHGLDSPVGRVYKLDGEVRLLGFDHDANTTIHLAEALVVPSSLPRLSVACSRRCVDRARTRGRSRGPRR